MFNYSHLNSAFSTRATVEQSRALSLDGETAGASILFLGGNIGT